ncbi:sigma-70 family RNA polymerase sigma factor [Tistrella bauzanensis]|uniref:Sigma-70 family RNA polymerase sigma factor n=1 Tax=Tistrella arctica TaxID=3133430 RepID=A0ABU9YDB8_9PROT
MRDDDTRLKARLRIFLDHRAMLVDYATPIVGDRMRAEDVVQEAYIRFAPGAETGRVAQPVGYLYRIVRNLALDMTRRRQTEDRNRLRHRPDWLKPADLPAPDQGLLDRDETRRMAAALASLPERERRALELHRLEGQSLQRIADHLEISVTSAHRLVQGAVVRLTLALRDEDGA